MDNILDICIYYALTGKLVKEGLFELVRPMNRRVERKERNAKGKKANNAYWTDEPLYWT